MFVSLPYVFNESNTFGDKRKQSFHNAAMSFGSRLRRARKAAGLSQDKLAALFGIARASVAQWESDQTQPEMNRLPLIAKTLQVSLDELLLNEPIEANRAEAGERIPTYGQTIKRIPVVGAAQAGDNGLFEELQYPVGHGDGYLSHAIRDDNAYALRVRGDSMRPRYLPGEFIIVSPNHPPQAGDDVIVRTADGRSMVKRLAWRRDGVVHLLSVNDDFTPISVPDEHVVVMHYVAGTANSSYLLDPTE